MASIRLTLTKPFKRIEPRRRPDLPDHITGTAFWRTPEDTSKPPSYHVGGYTPQGTWTELPIEFINNEWYALEWEDSSYWVSETTVIAKGLEGLGHPDFAPTPSTSRLPPPPPGYTSRTSSGRSRIRAPSPPSDPPSEENNEPRAATPSQGLEEEFLATAVQHVATLQGPHPLEPETGETPVLHHIATATTTVLPPPPIAAQPRPPLPRPHPPSPPAPPAMAAAAPNPRPNGGMKGNPPTIFTGNRDTSKTFLHEFGNYVDLNPDQESASIPYRQVILAISFIRGPQIDDWAKEQKDKLKAKLLPPRNIAQTDEVLWTEFETRFRTTFTDTAKEQQAYQKLLDLRMTGNDIDTYNTRFNYLLARSAWPRGDKGTMERYRRSLRRGIALKIYNKTPMPQTLDEWQEAARMEVLRQAQINADLGPNPFLR